MDVFTRENAIISVCVVLAIAAFFVLERYADVGAEVRTAVVLAIGVVLPLFLTKAYSS